MIKSLKPKTRDYKVADGKGMSLQVTTNGAKRWRFSYSFDGKKKTISLGTYPDTTLKMARDKRDKARQCVASGSDPSALRKAEKRPQHVEVKDGFSVFMLEWLEIKKKEWEPSYFGQVSRRMDRDVLPVLGRMPITQINPMDILPVMLTISDRGNTETARRTQGILSQVFDHAIQTGRALTNPARNLAGFLKKPKVRHMAAIIEPLQVGTLLRQIDSYECTFVVKCALRLAPLLFVRPGELRKAEWRDINFDTAEWCFMVSKTKKDHIVSLSRQALDIFRELHAFSGHGKYVFPGYRNDFRPMSSGAISSALDSMGFDSEEMTGHGFRAMASTLIAEKLGYPDRAIERQLSHSVCDPNDGAYDRARFLDERRSMMQDWADYLDNLRAGKDEVPSRTA